MIKNERKVMKNRYVSTLPLVAAIALMAMISSASHAQTAYVFVDGNSTNTSAPSDTNPGDSWAGTNPPYKYLQDGLARAAQLLAQFSPPSNVEIRVRGATGSGLTYKPDLGSGYTAGTRAHSFVLLPDVKIYGQYIGGTGGNADTRDPDYLTILSGDIGTANDDSDNSYHVVTADDGDINIDNCWLDGFTITKGNGDGAQQNGGGGGIKIIDGASCTTSMHITQHVHEFEAEPAAQR